MEFTLRPLRMEDAVSIARYANNSAIAGNLTNQFPHPYKLEDANRWLSMVTNPEHPSLILGIEIAGEVSGGIGLHPQADVWSRNAELGYWLAEPYWGKGIMTQAVREMVQTGFNRLAIDRIFARPFGSNIGSQRVLEKAGFVLEAKLKQTIYKQGRYEDELIYAVRR